MPKLISLVLVLYCSFASATQLSYPLPEYSVTYSAKRDANIDAIAAIELAKTTQRQVFIEVGGDWCTWCHVFDKTVEDNPELAKLFNDHFVWLKVSVDDENDNAEFIKGLPKFVGYPHFFVASAQGKIFLSQSPTDFVSQGAFDVERLKHFFTTVSAKDYRQKRLAGVK